MSDFIMTLSRNDVSARRQEAYVLVPLSARDADPSFWSWPSDFVQNATGQWEAVIHLVDLGVQYVSRIYYVPERSEFRLCATEIYNLGPSFEGCLLVVSKIAPNRFSTQVLCHGDRGYIDALTALGTSTASRTKAWGYR